MNHKQSPFIQLTQAVKNNSPSDVSHWAPKCTKSLCTEALVIACSMGHSYCIQPLLKYATEYNRAFWAAMEKKHLNCVTLLLPLTHLKTDHPDFSRQEKAYCVLEVAVTQNMPNFIATLLPYTDSFDRNHCLALAVVLNRPKCIDQLIFAADFNAAAKILNTQYSSSRHRSIWQPVFEYYASVHQAHTLSKCIEGETQQSTSTHRKI